MKTRVYLSVMVFALLAILTVAIGCSKTANDAQIASAIQDKLNADSGLQGRQLGVQSSAGTVSLSGTVDTEAERDAAAKYAASVPGVKLVVNNLTVAPSTASMEQTPVQPPAPVPAETPAPKSKPSASKPRHSGSSRGHSDDDMAMNQLAPAAPTPAPQAVTPPPPPAPPPPPQKVTVPAGTTLAVRLVDTLDSETAQQGQTFRATLSSPISVDGDIVIPVGHDVEGHVVNVQSAGKFAGKSLLALQLDRISAAGKYYNIQTDQWHREGSSRGKNTAEKVGAGAAIGAVLGGLIGGGKGAAIGAASGGGIGGGVQAATKGQQIKLPSETVLNFTLQSAVSVLPTDKGPHEGRQKLDVNQ